MRTRTLQEEAEKIQYSLRSTFFYRRRLKFKQLIQEIGQINSSQYDWIPPSDLGISKSSWAYIQTRGIQPCQVFCHPSVIMSRPNLIAYYRSISILSQKGIQRLAFGVKSLEEGRRRMLSRKRASVLARILNTYISSIIDGDPNFSVEDIQLAGMMNFGAQMNGSWRNEIGIEGSRRVKELILTHFLDLHLVSKIKAKDSTDLPLSPSPQIDDVQRFIVTNGYSLLFGTEPDISIFNPNNVREVAIEVKAGLDPAGALERYGAAKKSFDKVLEENRSTTTIYLASCITEGVRRALRHDRLVRREFNLTNIFVNEDAKEEFLNYIKWLMHL